MKFTNVITVLSLTAVAIAAPHIDHIERRTGDASCTNAGGALTCCQQQIKNTPNNDLFQKVLATLALLVPQIALLPQATAAIGITCKSFPRICPDSLIFSYMILDPSFCLDTNDMIGGGIGVVPAITPCASNTVCCMTPQTASSFSPGVSLLLP